MTMSRPYSSEVERPVPRPLRTAFMNRTAARVPGKRPGDRPLHLWLFSFLVSIATTSVQSAPIPDAEVMYPPTANRITSLHAAAQRDGWAPHAAALRSAALRAYERERLQAAEAWLNLFRWSELLGRSEAEFVPGWIKAVQAERVGHAGMPSRYEWVERPLAARVSPALQAWVAREPVFSAAFFALLSPVDYLPRVLEMLDELHRRDPARFKTYAQLALAIAVVYDVPPPPDWPHGQVAPTALVRRWPAATEAFDWWIRQEQRGRTFQRLARLDADELKFVVDVTAPFAELEWVVTLPEPSLGQLERAYAMIRYRKDRLAGNVAIWPDSTYTLRGILTAGGICSDQAYFATQLGKARGVPTLYIYGPGNDGRHAWFGFLDGSRKWQLDAGRYEEQRFVTGHARDPQTWRVFTDHELQFLSERFRELPAFRQSRAHAWFAAQYLALDRPAPAGIAARKAVNFERRNQDGWELLVTAARREGRDAKTIENLMREAAIAFQRYPELEADYVNRVSESLRARGEISAAEAEVRRIANKNRAARGDLSVQQARDIVLRAVRSEPLAGQIRAFNTVVDTYGPGAGVAFFDEVVIGFARHLLELKQKPEALRAVERARRVLNAPAGSQLEAEFVRLLQLVREHP